MVQAKFISLSRIWYTTFIVLIHIILIYFGIKKCYFDAHLPWPESSLSFSPKLELLIQKICLLSSIVLLLIFIYPSLFQIGNLSNDNRQLTINELNKNSETKSKTSLCTSLWHHCFSLSSTLHLIMSFLLIISNVLIDAKQIMVGLKDSGLLRYTSDFDLIFDWSLSIISNDKYFAKVNLTELNLSFSYDSYIRLNVFNFLLASFVSILREPYVFWSISKLFSIIYSFALLLNVLQWCLMYSSFQLLLKNICFNTIDSTQNMGYLLLHQPYTTFFLYILLEFLIYISSITFYYYGYNRFKYCQNSNYSKSSCYDRCSHYCPSLIAIIILLLYTSCKMPLVHDIFLLYIERRLIILFLTFTFEIIHVILILSLWIYLTTKIDWNIKCDDFQQENKIQFEPNGNIKNTNNIIQPPSTAISLPELNGNYSSTDKTSRRLSDNIYQKPYEKIRIFQSEIYYHDRPKNWSLPLNQQPTILAAFDDDDDDNNNDNHNIDNDDDRNQDENTDFTRSTSYPTSQNKSANTNEVQYRDAIRKIVPNIYKIPNINNENQFTKDIILRNNTPPIPPIKRFTQEQVEAAKLRAQQLIIRQQSANDYIPHHRSAALLISQV